MQKGCSIALKLYLIIPFFSVACGQRKELDKLPIIDAHIHTAFTGEPEHTSHIPVTLDELLKEMQSSGVIGAVAHTKTDGGGYADLRAQHILHCAGIDAQVDVPRVQQGLASGKYGCIKIYLGYVHQFAGDPNYEPAYALAKKYDVPVVFHTGDTYSTVAKLKFADPLTIDEVAVTHPEVRFVIAHCGNPWIESAAEVAYKNPNVYLDGSALLIGNLDAMPKEKIERYMVKPLAWIFGYLEDPSKLMFGTDWPLAPLGPSIMAFKQAIPQEHWREVFYENAARVFKIPR